mmetsp:Transcript_52433/g.124868  ORF Transcript_52433/g.124868 Transcript_52433/m.124868 type:complete len:284 (+) Transcript_52433:2406-3257(+)
MVGVRALRGRPVSDARRDCLGRVCEKAVVEVDPRVRDAHHLSSACDAAIPHGRAHRIAALRRLVPPLVEEEHFLARLEPRYCLFPRQPPRDRALVPHVDRDPALARRRDLDDHVSARLCADRCDPPGQLRLEFRGVLLEGHHHLDVLLRALVTVLVFEGVFVVCRLVGQHLARPRVVCLARHCPHRRRLRRGRPPRVGVLRRGVIEECGVQLHLVRVVEHLAHPSEFPSERNVPVRQRHQERVVRQIVHAPRRELLQRGRQPIRYRVLDAHQILLRPSLAPRI